VGAAIPIFGSVAYNGIKMELAVRDTTAMAANFHKADDELQTELRALAREAAGDVHTLAEMLAAKDTGFMADNLREMFTPSGLAFEVGWLADDFLSAGFAFYPWFVEFGTIKMGAQPALGPAADTIFPDYQERVKNAIRMSIDRLNQGSV
jgi:HK97 gp10 family phage protein